MIGKVVQSADQLCWFVPDSVYRTLAYNGALNVPFFNPEIPFSARKSYTPNRTGPDAVTVMLCQLFGPCSENRFSIDTAQQKVSAYKKGLKENILKIARHHGVQADVAALLRRFERR